MKTSPFGFILVATVFLIFSSCKNDGQPLNDAISYLPESVASVTSINVRQLMSKANLEEVKKLGFYQEMIESAHQKNELLADVLQNPEVSGIDLDKKILMASDFDNDNLEDVTNYFVLSIRDEPSFEKFFKSADATVEKSAGVKFILGEGAVIGWNEKIAVFTLSTAPTQDSEQEILKVFNQKKGNSLAANKDIRKSLNSEHDINTWITTNALYNNKDAGMALTMLDIKPEALKGNYITGYADFENGQLIGHSDFHFNKDLGGNFIGKFFKKEITTDFSKVLLKDKLGLVTIVALDFRGIDQFLSERPQSKGYADFIMKNSGIKVKDLADAFGGDLMVASYGDGGPMEADFLLALSIKSKEKVQGLLQSGVKNGSLKQLEKDHYKLIGLASEDFSIRVNKGFGELLLAGDMLIFSNNNDIVQKFSTGKIPSSDLVGTEGLNKSRKKALFARIDIASVQSYLGNTPMSSFKDAQFDADGKGADFVMTTHDGSTNSLQTILVQLDQLKGRRN